MRIKIIQSIADKDGIRVPLEMIGKEFEVIKEDVRGVWVKNGKLDVLVLFEEMEIVELGDKLTSYFYHYLKNVSSEKFHQELKSIGCNHLLQN